MKCRRLKSLVAIWLIQLLLAASNVKADPLLLNPSSPWYGLNFENGWHFDVGLGFEYEPTYAGSDKYVSDVDVSARALYRLGNGNRFFINIGELGGVFSLSPDTQLTAFLEFEEGREYEEDPALTGLKKIDSTIEGQFMLAHRFGNTTLLGGLQPDLSGAANKGLVWFLGMGFDWLSTNKQWRANTTFDISGADGEYMNTEFGITEEESLRTDYEVYQPSRGLKSLTWNLSAEYFVSKSFSLLGSIDTEYYLSEASNSPLISKEGAELTYEANLQFRYRF